MTTAFNNSPGRFNGIVAVWRRNVLVWRRLMAPSLLVNFGEPLLYLLGLGYGLGMFIGEMEGMSYLAFLASGIIASSAMNSATFEAMYSVYTRMIPQRTYEGMMATPMSVSDILGGELLWCASKSLISGSAILAVAVILGAVDSLLALWVIPITFIVGLCFAGPALVMTAFASGYDFFNYYMTLIITPMFMLCGVFFPIDRFPELLQQFVQLLPLTHAIALMRPLMAGHVPTDIVLHLFVLLFYATGGYLLAVRLVQRRLIV